MTRELEWIEEGKKKGADYLIVVCDTFNYEDYPVFASGAQDLDFKRNYYNGHNMQRVERVINLKSLSL